MKGLLQLFVLLSVTNAALAYTVPPGSAGFYHGNSTAAVTIDAHSFFFDNKRAYVFSGEVHTWRIPSGKPLWRDVFEKMKVSLIIIPNFLPYHNSTLTGCWIQLCLSVPPLGCIRR